MLETAERKGRRGVLTELCQADSGLLGYSSSAWQRGECDVHTYVWVVAPPLFLLKEEQGEFSLSASLCFEDQ